MATFTTAPDYGVQLSVKPRVRQAAFGDGYTQRVADGINTQAEEWALTFSARTASERDTILVFLEARNGVESFDWTSPAGTVGKFICLEWTYVPANTATHTITAKFTQVFDL